MIEDGRRTRNGNVRRRLLSSFAASLLVHAIAIMALALFVSPPPPIRRAVLEIIVAQAVEEPEVDLAVVDLEPVEEKPNQAPGENVELMDPEPLRFAEVAEETVAAVSRNVVAGPAIGELDTVIGEPGGGTGVDGLAAAGATFFGTVARGRRFVFVLDNSNSMGRGRLETAFMELLRAVDAMGPKQSFYVILFSDTAYRMFHPKPAATLVPATAENKRRLRKWLETVEMCLKTRGEEAVSAALAMHPDVISILGDGRFTDRATQLLTAPHDRGIVINTFGMQVDPRGRSDLEAIAAANRGTFKPVDTTTAAVDMARSHPIKKNTTRGKVWGLELPTTPKK